MDRDIDMDMDNYRYENGYGWTLDTVVLHAARLKKQKMVTMSAAGES